MPKFAVRTYTETEVSLGSAKCPHCSHELNADEIVKVLNTRVLKAFGVNNGPKQKKETVNVEAVMEETGYLG